MSKNYYLSGEFNLTCDRCSKKIKAHQAKHEWTGFIVCGDCYEVRHPQDFVKAKTDKITVPFTRPIPEYVFVLACTTPSALPGYAIPGCIQPSNPDEPGFIPT